MRTDLFTVNQDELIDLVASVMDWQSVRHVPVEDDNDQLVGLVNYRTILRHIMRATQAGVNVPVSEIMERDVITCTPEMLTVDALNLMREHSLSCLPVVQGDAGQLVGMITEQDFVAIARDLLEERLSDDSENE